MLLNVLFWDCGGGARRGTLQEEGRMSSKSCHISRVLERFYVMNSKTDLMNLCFDLFTSYMIDPSLRNFYTTPLEIIEARRNL